MSKTPLQSNATYAFQKLFSCNNWFLAFFLLLIATRLVAIILYSNLGPYADEDNYVLRGINFWKIFSEENVLLKDNYIEQFYYNGYWPPLFSIIISPFYHLAEYEGVRTFLALLDVIAGLLLYKIAKKVSSQGTANFTLLLYALNPFIWIASFSVLSEGLFNFFLFAFLLVYLKFIESNNLTKKKIVIYGALLGLCMGATILVRSAFILVFFMVFIVSIFTLPKRDKLPTFMLSGILMLLLTLPWNFFIMKQEGKFMFMHTISAQQFYMKFVDRSGGWNSIKEKLEAESSKLGVSPTELASQNTKEYFKTVPSLLYPLNTMITDFRTDYLFGITDHENRLRIGFFNSEGWLLHLNWATSLYHEIARLPLIILGLLTIVFPIGFLKHRALFIGLVIGTASVGMLGLTWGRHLVNLMPFLILGTAIFLSYAKNHFTKGYLLFSSLIVLGLGILGFNIWQTQERVNWSKPFEQNLISAGKKFAILDQIQLRKFDDCKDQMILDDPDNVWNISVQSIIDSGAESTTILHNQVITISEFVQLSITPKTTGMSSDSISFITDEKRGELRLDRGRTTEEWRSIENTCIKYKR